LESSSFSAIELGKNGEAEGREHELTIAEQFLAHNSISEFCYEKKQRKD